MDDLLETVLFLAEYSSSRPTPNTDARGASSRQSWTRAAARWPPCSSSAALLHVGDTVVVGSSYGRVRAMFGQHGQGM
ncbi:MAG: hypothetical protein V8S24_01355 [Gordonibacter pamelaeae]